MEELNMNNEVIGGLRGLSSVRVDKGFLLSKLESNKDQHEDTYKKAMKAWHSKILDTLNKELKKVKADKTYYPKVFVVKPNSHTVDYERVIDMLEASLDDEFELTSAEFSQYVRDEWDWKESFVTTVSGCYN